MIPSRTTPTECVFVIPIGPVRRPASRIHSRPGQLAVAVEAVAAGVDRLGPDVAVVGDDHRDAGPDRTLADDERAVAADRASRGRRGRRATSVIALAGPGRPRPMTIPRSLARTLRLLPCRGPPPTPRPLVGQDRPVTRSRGAYHRRVIHVAGERSAAPSPLVRLEPLPELAALRPIDVAEAFRDLPGSRPARERPARPQRPLDVPDRRSRRGPRPSPPPAATRSPVARRLLGRLAADAPAAARRRPADAPPFLGGLVGFLGYDLGDALERLPAIAAGRPGPAAPPPRAPRLGRSPGTAGPARAWLAGRARRRRRAAARPAPGRGPRAARGRRLAGAAARRPAIAAATRPRRSTLPRRPRPAPPTRPASRRSARDRRAATSTRPT